MPRDVGSAKDLALYRIEIAEQDLKTAIRNQDEEDYRAANNRAYYAIFHALDACLALEGKAFKRHGQAIGAFNKDFILTDVFPRAYGKGINEAEEIRRKSDYDDFYIISVEKTKKQVEFAKEFVKSMGEYVKAQIDEK